MSIRERSLILSLALNQEKKTFFWNYSFGSEEGKGILALEHSNHAFGDMGTTWGLGLILK